MFLELNIFVGSEYHRGPEMIKKMIIFLIKEMFVKADLVNKMCCHCEEELKRKSSFWRLTIHLHYVYFRFVHSLSACLHQLCGYKALMEEAESLRATAYNADNLEHEQSLLQLWSLLQPGIPLMTRKTKQWQNIGFQGEDPKTDFRGMGILGLENLR